MLNWLSKHKFQAHLTAFMLMILASIGMYFAGRSDIESLIWSLLMVFGLANILAIFVK